MNLTNFSMYDNLANNLFDFLDEKQLQNMFLKLRIITYNTNK